MTQNLPDTSPGGDPTPSPDIDGAHPNGAPDPTPRMLPPAGWYPDPTDLARMRWWDGANWTIHFSSPIAVPVRARQRIRRWWGFDQPRKWIGRRGGLIIMIASAAVWGYLFLLAAILSPHYSAHSSSGSSALSPFLLITGSSAIAIAVMYTMAYRLRPSDGMTVPFLIIAGIVGGLLATLAAIALNGTVEILSGGGDQLRPNAITLALAGVTEELCKIGAVLLFARLLPVRNVRTGLFLGGAVGFGFSVIENFGYLQAAWSTGLANSTPVSSLLVTVIGRQALGPFLHPMFTALFAAAVFASIGRPWFRRMLIVVGSYLAVAATHGLIDSVSTISIALSFGHRALAGVMALLLLGITLTGIILVWRHVAIRSRASIPDEKPWLQKP